MNDLPQVLVEARSYLYADGVCIFIKIRMLKKSKTS